MNVLEEIHLMMLVLRSTKIGVWASLLLPMNARVTGTGLMMNAIVVLQRLTLVMKLVILHRINVHQECLRMTNALVTHLLRICVQVDNSLRTSVLTTVLMPKEISALEEIPQTDWIHVLLPTQVQQAVMSAATVRGVKKMIASYLNLMYAKFFPLTMIHAVLGLTHQMAPVQRIAVMEMYGLAMIAETVFPKMTGALTMETPTARGILVLEEMLVLISVMKPALTFVLEDRITMMNASLPLTLTNVQGEVLKKMHVQTAVLLKMNVQQLVAVQVEIKKDTHPFLTHVVPQRKIPVLSRLLTMRSKPEI